MAIGAEIGREIARHVPEIACPSTPPALVAARVQTLDFRSGEDLLAAKIKGLDACASHATGARADQR